MVTGETVTPFGRGMDVSGRKLVIFDFDGTLSNTIEGITSTARTVLRAHGLSDADMGDLRRIVGPPFPEAFSLVYGFSTEEAEQSAIAMLAKMNLPNPERIMTSFPFELSGGMMQRVGVAMGMYFKPQLLLADEPTSALDVTTQAQVVEEMMQICRKDNTAIIIVTHNLGVAAYMADEIIVMQNGHVVERGTSDYIINHAQKDYTKELLAAVPQIGDEVHDYY